MKVIRSYATDPFFNIAAEDFFFRQREDDILFIYLNAPSVIIGKNQNLYAQLNWWNVSENQVQIVRRISGGGTVFHDPGNVNFAFFTTKKEGPALDYRFFLDPVIAFLATLGVEAYIEKSNSLFSGGYKFSGNAQHISGRRIQHHGTLLVNTDLGLMEKCLKTEKLYTDKAVASVPAKVKNLSDIHQAITDTEQVITRLTDFFGEDDEKRELSWEKEHIDQLAAGFREWEWTFGKSPAYTFNREIIIRNKPVDIHFVIEKGRVVSVQLPGYSSEEQLIDQYYKNKPHDANAFLAGLKYLSEKIDLNSHPEDIVKNWF